MDGHVYYEAGAAAGSSAVPLPLQQEQQQPPQPQPNPSVPSHDGVSDTSGGAGLAYSGMPWPGCAAPGSGGYPVQQDFSAPQQAGLGSQPVCSGAGGGVSPFGGAELFGNLQQIPPHSTVPCGGSLLGGGSPFGGTASFGAPSRNAGRASPAPFHAGYNRGGLSFQTPTMPCAGTSLSDDFAVQIRNLATQMAAQMVQQQHPQLAPVPQGFPNVAPGFPPASPWGAPSSGGSGGNPAWGRPSSSAQAPWESVGPGFERPNFGAASQPNQQLPSWLENRSLKAKDADAPAFDGKTSWREYVRRVRLFVSNTTAPPHRQATRLLEKLSGDAWEHCENLGDVSVLEVPTGVDILMRHLERRFEVQEHRRVGGISGRFLLSVEARTQTGHCRLRLHVRPHA